LIVLSGWLLVLLLVFYQLIVFENEMIVKYIDAFNLALEYNIYICIVFELLVGMDISKSMSSFQRGAPGFALRTVWKFGYQLLNALSCMAKSDIIHADLKPANIMQYGLPGSTTIKIVDLGLGIVGKYWVNYELQTMFYRAPEVYLDTGISPKIDIWSLGCMLFELYTGFVLFPAYSELNLLLRHIQFFGFPPVPFMNDVNQHSLDYYFSKNRTTSNWELYSNVYDTPLLENQYMKARHRTSQYPVPIIECERIKQSISNIPPMSPVVKWFQQNFTLSKLSTRSSELPKSEHQFFDLIFKMLTWSPKERMSASEALKHPFFFHSQPSLLFESNQITK
jgi:serine/threonine protein kinase